MSAHNCCSRRTRSSSSHTSRPRSLVHWSLSNLIAGILGASRRASVVLPDAGSPQIRTSRVDVLTRPGGGSGEDMELYGATGGIDCLVHDEVPDGGRQHPLFTSYRGGLPMSVAQSEDLLAVRERQPAVGQWARGEVRLATRREWRCRLRCERDEGLVGPRGRPTRMQEHHTLRTADECARVGPRQGVRTCDVLPLRRWRFIVEVLDRPRFEELVEAGTNRNGVCRRTSRERCQVRRARRTARA